LRGVVDFEAVAFKVPEEVSCTQSIGTRWIVMVSLLRGSWCCRYLLTGVVIGLSGINWLLNLLLTYTWGRSSELLLSPNSAGSVGVLVFLTLFIGLSILWWYVCGNDQDLAI
jgi:hypothetical protein